MAAVLLCLAAAGGFLSRKAGKILPQPLEKSQVESQISENQPSSGTEAVSQPQSKPEKDAPAGENRVAIDYPDWNIKIDAVWPLIGKPLKYMD